MCQHFAFFLIFSQKKKEGRNHIKLLLATFDHHILYYTTKRDRTHHLWEKIFPKHL